MRVAILIALCMLAGCGDDPLERVERAREVYRIELDRLREIERRHDPQDLERLIVEKEFDVDGTRLAIETGNPTDPVEAQRQLNALERELEDLRRQYEALPTTRELREQQRRVDEAAKQQRAAEDALRESA